MVEIAGFSLKKTSFLSLHLFEIGSSGVPVSEMVLVLASPLMKAVFMESIPVEQTSGTFIDKLNLIVLKSSKLVSMKFFESKKFPRNFSPWNWFPGDFSKQTCSMIFRSTYFVLNVLQKIKNSFFSMFQFLKRVFSEYLLLEMIILIFLGRNQLPWFFCELSSLWWISPEWNFFLGFSIRKLISMDFQITFFFSWSYHGG